MSEQVISEESEQAERVGSEAGQAFKAVVNEAVKLLESVGRAVVATSQDVTQRMVVRVDQDTRQHLDVLVSTGAVRSRSEAASYLMQEGIKAQAAFFERVMRTNEQIAQLRQQLRSLSHVRVGR